MQPVDITYALKRLGTNQAAVARSLNLKPAAVSAVINGRSRSLRVATRISELTGFPLGVLWPGAYDSKPRDARRKAV